MRSRAGAARPLINIVRAQYGQPGGIKNGRGAFDVTDSLQARVHAARGRFCIVKRDEHLPSWFGEPSGKGQDANGRVRDQRFVAGVLGP